ncbi:hypothetical protein MVEN_01108700 [Mycena venus]|uniref:Uncharacterized protein n=1 Tax=Mycena venus TaxID=2733690 RepID=A0A8H6Y4U7_9AGAR|nr:hypothetical protein MVEN_01108700 [Mycena venus]
MRSPRVLHVLFPVLAAVLVYTPFARAQANRTVDDFSPLITYTPASNVTHLDTTGFDVTKLYNGTIGIMNATQTVNMTMKFTGTAVWLFLAKPETTDTFSDSYTIFLDDVEVDDVGDVDLATDAEYGNLAFSNDTLHLGPHVVTLATSGVVYFDYLIFTSNDPTPETTIPPVQPPSSSASATSTIKPKNTGHPAATPSQSGTAQKSKSHVAVIAGAAAAVLLLLGAGIGVFLFLRRRRGGGAPSKQYVPGGGHPGPYGAQGQPVYGTDPAAHTSEAALLRVPTMTPSTSQHSHMSPSVPMPPPPMPMQHDSQNAYQYQTQPQYPPQPQYQPQSQSPYASPAPTQSYYTPPVPATESYHPHSQSQQQHNPADPFAYIQPQDAAMQRMMAEQRAVEAEYAAPTAWVVDEKPASQSYPSHPQQYQSHLQTQPQLQQRRPQDALAYPQPQDSDLQRVIEKHRATEAEYASSRPTPAQTWPDEKRSNPQGQMNLDVPNPPQTPSPSPSSATHTNWSAVSDTYPPTPSSPGSSSAHGHGEAALSTIAAQMAALRAQVARLEGERREELPPAYD